MSFNFLGGHLLQVWHRPLRRTFLTKGSPAAMMPYLLLLAGKLQFIHILLLQVHSPDNSQGKITVDLSTNTLDKEKIRH